jgi:hypothetical protein
MKTARLAQFCVSMLVLVSLLPALLGSPIERDYFLDEHGFAQIVHDLKQLVFICSGTDEFFLLYFKNGERSIDVLPKSRFVGLAFGQ